MSAISGGPLGRARTGTGAARRQRAGALAVLLAVVLAGGLVVLGTGGSWLAAVTAAGDERPLVVSSTTILADLARQVGGERVRVYSLLSPGQDPHTYEPVPRDGLVLSHADLVLLNGYGLDVWAERLLAGAEGEERAPSRRQERAPSRPGAGERVPRLVVRVAEEVPVEPLPWPGTPGHSDPHLWMDPTLVILFVERLRDALAHVDPQGTPEYARRAAELVEELRALDAWIRDRVATIPPDRRKLITTHDAYRYFGRRYGIEILDTVWGISTEEEPSAAQLARLFGRLRAFGLPAFVETTINPKLMEELAAQAGVRIGGQLYADALGPPGSGA
ncbi:MAG TPA: zinc ABC transporter substrate-binding protein, partial [Thermaerobacter sp.]